MPSRRAEGRRGKSGSFAAASDQINLGLKTLSGRELIPETMW